MLNYNNYLWTFKAKFWQVAGGKFHWHNPVSNRVEDFHPGHPQAGQGPHEEIHEPKPSQERAEIRGEWWLDDSGQSTFADGDVGDADHARVAFESALGISFEDADEDMPQMFPHEKLSDAAVAWLREQGADEEAIQYLKRGKDPREYAMKKMGWIRVKNHMFQAAEFNDNALKNIQNFIFEEIEHPEESEVEVTVEELSSNKVYDVPIKYLVMERATAEGLKRFADRRRGSADTGEGPHDFSNIEDNELRDAAKLISSQSDEEYYSDDNPVHNRTEELIHKFVKHEAGSDNPEKVIEFYKKKYGINVPVKFSWWEAERAQKGQVEIRYNKETKKLTGAIISLPKPVTGRSSSDRYLASLRHEIEHIKDAAEHGGDFNQNDLTNKPLSMHRLGAGESVIQSIRSRSKGHHSKYDNFNIDFLRDSFKNKA
jgi:hypothetical protein